MSRCVCLIGVDGSGKTTLSNVLMESVKKEGCSVRHVWSRYRNYLSKPLLAITRITGHNYKVNVEGVKIGYHDFHTSKILSYSFLFLQWIDQYIDIHIRFRNKTDFIVSDRCVIDTLIDLCVDTKMDDFIFGNYGRSLLRLMPADSMFFFIARDKGCVFENRPDVKIDRNYDRRVELYERAVREFSLSCIDNDRRIKDAVADIYCAVFEQELI